MGRRRMASTLALLVVVAGLGLIGYSLLGENSPLQKIFSAAKEEEEFAKSAPKDTTLKLSIPKMERVKDLNVYDTPYEDETALEVGAQHVQGTGFPWEEEANVYIAGHRLGYPGTDSYLVFYDLDKLEEGDEVILTDSDGTRYTYEVFKNFITGPYDWSVTEPVSGKNIVTLQTCTLPDYSDRVIIQAELTKVEPGEGASPAQDKPAQKVESAPAEPVPVEQTPIESAPVEPLPVGPAQEIGPAPVEPVPIEPVQTG